MQRGRMRLIALTKTVTTFVSATVCTFQRGLDILLCAPLDCPKNVMFQPFLCQSTGQL